MADDRKERYINPYTDFGFKKQAEIAKFSPKERQDNEESVKIYRDLKNSLDTAEWKAKVKIAREMKADGIPTATISKYTKLPIEEIERL
jgi:hypothetical protein